MNPAKEPAIAITRRQPMSPQTEEQLIDELRRHRDEASRLKSLNDELGAQIEYMRAERDEARSDLVKALQTIEGAADAKCTMCGYGGHEDEPVEKFAVWLHSRGWLIDVCGGEASVADRLCGATWFSTWDEARAALLSVDDVSVAEDVDVGEVVSL